MIPMALLSAPYLFRKARYGTCQFFVYTLLLDDNFDSKYVLYLVQKVFSRRIQRCRLQDMGPSIHRECWQLSDRLFSDQNTYIGAFQIETTPSWTFPFAHQTFSVNSEPIAMVFGLI